MVTYISAAVTPTVKGDFGMRNPDYRAMLWPLRFLVIFHYGGLIP
jgi:hypothetical protein